MTQATVDKLNQQMEDFIHGPGRDQILQQLEGSPTADTAAQLSYDLIMKMDGQAAERGTPLGIDVVMGVATEVIDMMIEIMEAMGVQLVVEEMQEEILLKVVLLHMKAVEGDPEEKAAAEEMLAALTADGTMEQSMQHIAGKADASPEQMQAAGTAMAAPKQNPVAAGVQQGLMQ